MVILYKELQPIDSYSIRLSYTFSDYDRQLLTLFYQPLIGPEAMSLYMTLWADFEEGIERDYNHYHLMNLLTMPLGTVFEARIALEAIGLMRTSRKIDGDIRSFIYELIPPLDAKAFFSDPLLSTFLFSKIGEQAYRSLRARFIVVDKNTVGFEDVSRTFLDVYTPVHPGSNPAGQQDVRLKGRTENEGIPFGKSNFDFDLLRSGLSEQMVPHASLSAVSKEVIEKLAFLYSLNPLDMQKVVMMALDEDLKLPEERLRKATADYYKMNVSKEAPVLHKVYNQEVPKQPAEQLTRDDELVYYLENTPPLNMLRDINGKEPLSVDVKLAEKLINTHGLPIGVVNVLLQYVHLRNDGKITNSYVERIASHWMNKHISTVRDALEISRNEHDQYVKWKNEGQKQSSSSYKRKSTREARVPEWFYKKEHQHETKPETIDPDIDEKRRQLVEKLNAMKNGVK